MSDGRSIGYLKERWCETVVSEWENKLAREMWLELREVLNLI